MPHTSFNTLLGRCTIEWHDAGLTRFLLPGSAPPSEPGATESAPPPWVQEIIERIGHHLAGDFQDFSDLRYDFSKQPAFVRDVLLATLAVKSGYTATYGEIAAAIGESPAASRAVGAALGANRWPLLIPCHRIVASSGKMTGYSGPGGVATKVRLLALEGQQLLAE